MFKEAQQDRERPGYWSSTLKIMAHGCHGIIYAMCN